MKKKIVLLGSVLFLLAAVQGFSLGIGIRASRGYDWGGGILISTGPGSDDKAMHFGVNYNFGEDAFYLGVTGDYLLLDKPITPVGSGSLDWYLGAGLFIWIHDNDDFGFGGGLRVPIGLDLNFGRIDIFLEVAPQIGLSLLPSVSFGGSDWVNGAIGFRFWF
jgi:hypothetical protein